MIVFNLCKFPEMLHQGAKGLVTFLFIPNYNPWEQRIAPNGDFFRAIRKGTASIVTDHIDRF
jgi:cation diffusion facilitator CzcD-associated flavoprotein CzcO